MDAYSIVCHLREHYNEQASIERFKVSEMLFGSKMEKGTSPVKNALKMFEHIERLIQLGYWMVFELSVDLMLASLPDGFPQFVLEYRINYIMSTIPKLINLLETVESSSKKEKKHVMLMHSSSSKNKKRNKSTQAEEGVAEKKGKECRDSLVLRAPLYKENSKKKKTQNPSPLNQLSSSKWSKT